VIQQLRDAFRDEPSHRFVILDNDSIFSMEVADEYREWTGTATLACDLKSLRS